MEEVKDTIYRQAAIDAIRASASKYTGFMEMEMYTDDDAVEAIEGLPSAQQEPHWIPCSERLPEKGTNILICDMDGDIYLTHMTRYESFYDDSGNRIKNVRAWMPLPEPYREEGD